MRSSTLIVAALAAVLLTATGALAGGGAATAEAVGAGAGRKLLLMHYMPWYQTPEVSGYWGGHWTGWSKQHDPSKVDAEGRPDIWSHYHPLIGTYDSADEAVIECHLLQMKLAGVDGVIADWYGIAELNDYPPIHTATKKLFEAADAMGMSFAACYEDRTVEQAVATGVVDANGVPAHLGQTFRWMERHWFGMDGHVRVNGRPLVLNFGPIYVKDAAVWREAMDSVEDRPALFALHHLWKNAGADGGFTWVHPEVYRDDPSEEEIASRIRHALSYCADDPERIIVSALPGFRDVYEHSHPVIEHRGGETLREFLREAMAGPSQIVQLVTWNDYGEGTIIEPTHEFGYTFLEVIQRARRAEVGAAFAFTADDLRLPARLLELRRAGTAPQAALDRIAELLGGGRCAEARSALEALGG